MAEIKVVSPLRLQAYRDEKNNTQTYQWVMSEYESAQLAKWKSVINGAEVIVQEVHTVDIVGEMYFSVKTSTTAAGAILTVSQTPTLTLGGECTYGGDTETFLITDELWGINALMIFLNGVKQKKGEDVIYLGTVEEPDPINPSITHTYAQLKFNKRLQEDDLIVIDYFRGL